MKKHIIAATGLLLTLTSCHDSPKSNLLERWDQSNNPVELWKESDLEYNFEKLPLKGEAEKKPWSGDYWPTYTGGISFRYWHPQSQEMREQLRRLAEREGNDSVNVTTAGQTSEDEAVQAARSAALGYDIITREQVESLSGAERRNFLLNLSPAEKYDIYNGNWDFPTVADERKRTKIQSTLRGSDSFNSDFVIPTWEGLCHAWAPATILFDEPDKVDVKSADNYDLTFRASDVKALLTYMMNGKLSADGKYRITPYRTKGGMADRCWNEPDNAKLTSAIQEKLSILEVGNNESILKFYDAIDVLKSEKPQIFRWSVLFDAFAVALRYASSPETAQSIYSKLLKDKFEVTNVYLVDPEFAFVIQNYDYLKTASSWTTVNPSQFMKEFRDRQMDEECDDGNAGAFHVAMTNLMGIEKKSFVIDKTRTSEVWNQAVVSYESQVLGEYKGDEISENADPDTVREVEVFTKLLYTTEVAYHDRRINDDRTILERTSANRSGYHVRDGVNTRHGRGHIYRLEINASGDIIGGSWITDARPDFSWTAGDLQPDKDRLPILDIYYKSLGTN